MKLNRLFKNRAAGNAFIGHNGVGSRVIIQPEGRGFSIQQSVGSQLWLIFSLLAMILVPAYAYFFDRAKIHGGAFGYSVLALSALIATPFFIKYTLRLLGRRRIHVDPVLQKVFLYSESTTATETFDFSSIEKIELRQFEYRSDQTSTDNFTVRIVNRDGRSIDLCTSDHKDDATKVEQHLSQAIGVKSGT